MEKEQFIELLSKKLSGEIVEEDRILLEKAIKDTEAYQKISVKLDLYFKDKVDFQSNTSQLNRVWEKIEVHQNESDSRKFDFTQPKKNPFLQPHWLKIAAMLVLLGTSIMGYYLFHNITSRDLDRKSVV